jgi:hypothetical protein
MAQSATDSLLSRVTRIDIVHNTLDPREYWADSWSLSIQDDGKTLKLFAEGYGDEARDKRDAELLEYFSKNERKLT